MINTNDGFGEMMIDGLDIIVPKTEGA